MPHRPPHKSWTEEQDRELRHLQAEELSAPEIVNALRAIRPGVKRNSVMGRLHRMGLGILSSRAETISKAMIKSHADRRGALARPRSERMIAVRPRTAPMPHTPRQKFPDVPHDPVSLFEAKFGQCRWPLNDKEPIDEFRFCGRKTVEGSSWCAGHARMAYT